MNKIRTLALIASLAALAPAAHAQWYVGASAGQARAPFSTDGLNNQFLDLAFSSAQTSNDTRDSAWRAFGGYQLNPYLALEAGYADLGRFAFQSTVTPTGTFDTRFKVKGYDAGAVAMYPVWGALNLFGRVGVFRAEQKTSYSATGSVELLAAAAESTQHRRKTTHPAGAT